MFIVPAQRSAEPTRTSRADPTPAPTPASPTVDASQFATGDLLPAQLMRLGATPVATVADATRIGTVPAASITNVSDPSRSLSQVIGRTSVAPGSVAIVLPDGSRHAQNEQHYSTLDDARRAVDALRNAGLGDFSQDVRAENVMGLSAPAGVEQYTIRGCNVGLMLASIANGNVRGVGLDLQQQGAGGWASTAENTGARSVNLNAPPPPALVARPAPVTAPAPSSPGRTSVAPGSVAIVLPDGSRHVQNEQHYSTLADVRRALEALRNAGLGDFSRDVRAEDVSGLSAPPGVEQYTIRGCNVGLILASIAQGNVRGVGLDLQQQRIAESGARPVAV